MAKKWFESVEGETSMMRVMAMLGTCIGAFVAVAGVAVGLITMFSTRDGTGMAIAFVSAGAGLITGLGFAKSLQRGNETPKT